MKYTFYTITALTLAILLVAPSVYMVQVGKVYGEIDVPKMAVETFAETASDTIVQCTLMPFVGGLLEEWLPWFSSTRLQEQAMISEGVSGPGGVVADGALAATVGESTAVLGEIAGLVAVTVPTLDAISAQMDYITHQQNTLLGQIDHTTALATTDISKETSSNTFKECVLDPLVNNIKEMLIDSITADLVAWIESGFEGEPAFLTNPTAYFKDIGKAAVSAYLYDSGMDEFICEPFRVDVILQFLWDYETPPQSQFGSLSCDLEDVFSEGVVLTVGGRGDPNNEISGQTGGGRGGNSTTTTITRDTRSSTERYRAAVEEGDFNAGGALMGMSKMLEPGNNQYDQTVRVQANAKAKIDNIEATEKTAIAQGSGWLSQRCDTDGDGKKEEVCTPGHYIAGQVDQWMGSSLSQLELADEFAEILDALIKYVVTEILTSVSGDYGLLHVRT
jgi:hypothetical protein